ncbi:thioredoxin family protein [Oceanobacillus halophilus]|uniref:Thioredoxin family protein n=1 Tax=Oceanobacillus halophilus TaxID=930130 RepID=A0A494ZTP9_9BACI|nr:thioredoxin family protein [Oceanobacillus halophilus]RKQ29577.1 thioredoxin family protein [Oceanobacillus halophilus]
MDLNQWFEKGMSATSYIESMEKNKDGLKHIYQNFQLPDEQDFFNKIKEKKLRALVLTEDWCGDAMLNIPILLKLSDKTDIEVRMLLRDQNLELMDQYLTNGKSRSIPIFIFMDEQGNEVAKWGPRAGKVQQFVDESRSKLPPQDDVEYQMKTKELFSTMQRTFQEHEDFWNEVYQSIKSVL